MVAHHTHPNAAVLERLFQAFQSGDSQAMAALFADDVVFHMPGRGRMAGTFKGKEAVFGWLEGMGAAAGEGFEADVHAIMADDEHAVALITERGEKNGKTYEWREVDVYHVSNGKITEGWVIFDDLYAADEFFG